MRVTKYKSKLTGVGKVVLEKEVSINFPSIDRKMSSPDKIANFSFNFLEAHKHAEEHLYMICLNNKLQMTSIFEISRGNVNSSIFSVREILQKALLANAVSVIMLHNHPSGDPTPSNEDISVTKRLIEAGQIVGIDVLDHLIIGNPSYISLKEKGHI